MDSWSTVCPAISRSFSKKLDYEARYIQPEEKGKVLSWRFAYHPEHWHFGAAYTKAFDTERFLFPKELGRDHFFTSIPRSRLEGLGDADVFTLSGDYDFNIKGLTFGLEFTEVLGTRIDGFAFNKYNSDEYYQVNTRLHYEMHGFLEGLNFDVLYVLKENLNNTESSKVFNQSNFHQINFVTNYIF
ncbi:hypothetical protein D1013_09620 [Euzebyella marina]|uniref:Uncharacterized protein n=1 Tax=Euzebyella marina TaxID=1761453 RepID=A0A3G2L5V5_9FLAO|nr:hypothetical protein [Euzebyella marina]AYN67603.1 hypothetical protein D1013_09620 [Euzebyella marina]